MSHGRSGTFVELDEDASGMSIRGMIGSPSTSMPPPSSPSTYSSSTRLRPNTTSPSTTTPTPKRTTKAKGAKRRATNAFLTDPTMKTTMTGVKSKQKPAANERPAAALEQVELQMLRGIFAAHDENKDGIINKSQLAEALVSLGFSPSEKLMTKFFLENAKHGKKHWRLDLETFLAAASKHLDSADDCAADVMYLFETFDNTNSGEVTAQVIRHLLHEAVAPTRLSRQETDEFMAYAEVTKKGLRGKVDYESLVDKLMF